MVKKKTIVITGAASGIGRAWAKAFNEEGANVIGCDINQVIASGPKGRITKDDVTNHINRTIKSTNTNIDTNEIANIITNKIKDSLKDQDQIMDNHNFSQYGPIEVIAQNNIAKITAKRMTTAWQSIPQVTQFDEAQIDRMSFVYKKLKSRFPHIKISQISFYVHTLVKVLKKMPLFNSSIDGNQIILKKYYNIGIAVDTQKGLIVPVIKNADRLSLRKINTELNRLVDLAKSDSIQIKDLQGSTFTISSLGGIGGRFFTPIINPPEVAILGISRSHTKLMNTNKGHDSKLILPLSLTYYHRVINGAEGARFTSLYKKLLNSYSIKMEG